MVPTRTYTKGDLSVEWRTSLCIHCEACFQGLPQVFDPNKRPWVNLDGAMAEEVKSQVLQCPSGALAIGGTI